MERGGGGGGRQTDGQRHRDREPDRHRNRLKGRKCALFRARFVTVSCKIANIREKVHYNPWPVQLRRNTLTVRHQGVVTRSLCFRPAVLGLSRRH